MAADNGSEKPPSYESVKDLLDADEVVTAKDLEIEMGASFDIEKDFSNIEISDSKKVTFEEAMNDQKCLQKEGLQKYALFLQNLYHRIQ